MPASKSSQRRRRYVTFERPPVGEVAIAVQFSEPAIDFSILAALLVRVRGDFPVQRQHPPLAPIAETFDVPPPLSPLFQIQIGEEIPMPRTWLLTAAGDVIVQVQADRFALNWRRPEGATEYPRYEALKDRFDEVLKILSEVADEAGSPLPSVDICEVTYVNPIEVPGQAPKHGHADLSKILKRVRGGSRNGFLPAIEDMAFQARYRIPAPDAAGPVGRLHLQAFPALKPHGNLPIYVVQLIGRVIPTGTGRADIDQAMDTAHRWAVLGFKDATTPQMHKQWGLKGDE